MCVDSSALGVGGGYTSQGCSLTSAISQSPPLPQLQMGVSTSGPLPEVSAVGGSVRAPCLRAFWLGLFGGTRRMVCRTQTGSLEGGVPVRETQPAPP